MIAKRGLRFLAIAVPVLLSVFLAASLAGATVSTPLTHGDSPESSPTPDSGATVLGIDCGLGSTAAVGGVSPNPLLVGDGVLDTSCSWIGDVDASIGGTPNGVVDPLVSDDVPSFSNTGGGFMAEVRATGLPPQTNGIDITVTWDTRYLYAVKLDLSGLLFATGFATNTTINNSAGVVRLATALLGDTVSGDVTFFRIRFDVVGVGISPLNITNDIIFCPPCSPSAVPHKTQPGSFDSKVFYDPSSTLGWNIYWSTTPSPAVPGSTLTFTATASCPGCGGALTYNWDWTSDGTNDASGSSVTLNPPHPIITRVKLTVSRLSNSAVAVRRLPLTVAITGTTPINANTAQSYSGYWLGGFSPYTGNWRLCPTTSPTLLVCTNPAPTITSTTTQGPNTQSVTYKYGGVYSDTLRITESTPSWVQTTPISVTATYLLTVTPVSGFPAAYVVTVTNPAKANTSSSVTITATMQYAGDSAVVLDLDNDAVFDSGETLVGGALPPVGTVLKSDPLIKYRDATTGVPNQRDGTECVFIDANPTNNLVDADENIGGTCPGTGGTIRNNDARLKYVDENNSNAYEFRSYPGGVRSSTFEVVFSFGDATTATVTGGVATCALSPTLACQVSVSKAYSGPGTFAITAAAKETAGVAASKIQQTGTSSIVINLAAPPISADFTFSPPSPIAGSPVDFTASASGGTPPYSYNWNFGDSSTGSGQTTSHTYATKGSKTVVLTVTDSASGSTTATHTVTVSPLALTAPVVTCPPSITAGKVFTCTATSSGGTTPYSFSGLTQTASTKGSFTFTVTVTDANSATASSQKTVTVVAQPLVATVDCPNSGLTAGKPFSCTVSASGGTSPYTGTGSFSVSFSAKGTYTQSFTVTDANAVAATGSDTVVIVAQALVVTVDCPNTGLTAGKPFNCNVTASGGTGPYTGTGTFSRTQPVKGTFTQSFTVTDANAVSATGSDTVVIGQQPFVVTVDCPNTGLTAGKPFNCNVSASGGTSPYTGTGTISRTQPVKGTFTQSFTVTDANGKSATGSDSVVIAQQPLVVTVDCPNAGLTAGKPYNCIVSATGGTTPYTGTGTFSRTQPVKGTFTHSFTVIDANAKSATGSDTVAITGQPLVVTVDCPNTGLTAGKPFSCTVTATGGTSPYAGTGSFSRTQPVKGTYTQSFTVTDANAVSATGSDSVVIAQQPLVVTVDCPNAGLTAGKPFSCIVSATGGTSPYTGAGTFSRTQPVKGTFTQTFTVTDANAKSTQGSDSVVIAQQPLVVTVDCPNTGLTAGKPFNCTVSASGGTSPYTGTGTFSRTQPVKGTFTQSFTVTDANAKSATGSDSVIIAAQPLIVTVDCPNTGLTAGKPFNCIVTAGGGTSPYTGTGTFSRTQAVKGTFTQSFTVTDANTVSATGSDSVTIAAQALVVTVDCPNTGLTAGKPFNCTVSATGGTSPYTGTGTRSATQSVKGTFTQSFTVTDANTVSATGSDSVTIAAQPLAVTVDCPNTGLTAGKPFNCVVSATGGTAPYTGTGTLSRTQPVKGTFTQSFTVTDVNAVSAAGSDSVTIVQQPLIATVDCPNAGLTAGKPFNCSVAASGGTSPYQGTGTFSRTQPVKGTFTQSFTVTDANGKSTTGSDSVVIAQQPLVVTVDCPNTGLTAGKPFNCTVTASGGTAPYTGTGTFSRTQPVKGTFTQSFTVTDANAVSAAGSDTVLIAQQPLVVIVDCPNTGLTTGKPFNCSVSASGGTAPYTGTGSFSRVEPVKGTFTETFAVTDANGKTTSGSDSVVISQQPLVVTVDCPDTGSTAGKPFNCSVSAAGGTSPYTGTGTFSRTEPVKGTYTESFTVTDANGKSAIGSDQVLISSQPLIVTVDCPNSGLTSGKPFTCSVSASGGTAPYQGAGGRSASFPSKGTYTVTFSVTDANSASASGSDSVVISPQPLVLTASCTTATAGKPTLCSAVGSGGTSPYMFAWDVGGDGTVEGQGQSFSTSFPVKGAYTIVVRVNDANAATTSYTLTLTVASQPITVSSIVITPSPWSVPVEDSPVTFSATAAGGTSPYVFAWDLTGDGVTDVQGNPVQWTYSTGQTVTVRVTATDLNSMSSPASTTTVRVFSLTTIFRFDWADHDNSGLVDIVDIANVAICFGKTSASPDWANCEYWDIDLTGGITIVDVAFAASMFSMSVSSPYPGQGQAARVIDPSWELKCSGLEPLEQAYCMSRFP